MPVAPAGMSQVHFADGSSTTANETAISQAIMTYAMNHKRPYQDLCVLGFDNASHGQSVVTLSASAPEVNSESMPTYDWPRARFPSVKYPRAANERENAEEEQRSLDEVR